MSIDFGEPVYVDELPAGPVGRGRQPLAPALEAWLTKIEDGKTAELPSKDEDGAHPVNRVQTLRKVAAEKFPNVKIETRALVPGKRYRIFATATVPTPNGRKATTK